MDTNLLKLNKELIESKQSNVGEQIATQVGNVFSALKKFEDDTEALAIENADLLEADAIGVDLLPEAGKEFMYSEFTRIGEEMADAVNRKDKKRIRDLKLEGTNLIAAQNTIGQMLKDHANDLFGTGGEGNYSKGSNKLMMNMLMNKEYSIRKDGREMVIDFNGPNGKKGVKITDLDKHVYLKIDDLAINYDNEIKNIRQAAIKGLPFEKDAFAKVVNQTLNTVPKLVSSIWDDSFTLKDGKTMKELWEAEPKNAGKDANQYLRSGGDNWDENAIREFAKEKLMQGGTNDFTAYTPQPPTDPMGDDGIPTFKNYVPYSYIVGEGKNEKVIEKKLTPGAAQTLFLQLQDGVVDDPQRKGVELRYIDGSDGTGWYDGNVLAYETTSDLVKDNSLNEPQFQNIKTKIVQADTRDDNTYDVKYKTGATFEIMNDGDKVVASKLNKLIFPQNDERNPRGLYFDTKNMIQQEVQLFDKANKPVIINGKRVTYSTSKKASMDVKSKTLKTILDMLNDQKLLKSVEYDNKVNSNPNVKYTYRDGSEVSDEIINKIEKKKKFKFKNKRFNFKSE